MTGAGILPPRTGARPATPAEPARIVLLVPPAHGRVPPETRLVCPPEVTFDAIPLALASLTLGAYREGASCALEVAATTSSHPPAALSLMGTSLSFFAGRPFEERLRHDLAEAAGCPSTTMAGAVVRALIAVGARHPLVVTAYAPPVNHALTAFLAAWGIAGQPALGLNITDVLAVEDVPVATLLKSTRRAMDEADKRGDERVDGILISCGGLQSAEAVGQLEKEFGLPVVTSSLAGPWDVLGLVGRKPMQRIESRLLATPWIDHLQGTT